MKVLKILLVEDHEADVRLVEEALFDCHIMVNLKTVSDGEQAIKFLKRQDEYQKEEQPDLIILDLNMPRKDGHEFLDEMKVFLKEKEIPVVLLTVSDERNDHERALRTHLTFFLSKPVNAEKLYDVLEAINDLWALAGTSNKVRIRKPSRQIPKAPLPPQPNANNNANNNSMKM